MKGLQNSKSKVIDRHIYIPMHRKKLDGGDRVENEGVGVHMEKTKTRRFSEA
ncbi:hypothetical protein MKW92_020237 [Papaver armeniacum]|nr:hypothetical protein MKW92_020237 [Papaver armeniacum]